MKNKIGTVVALLVSGTLVNLIAEENIPKPVAEYLTARDTGQKLARVADLDFAPLPQPTEQQQCVFVDDSVKFQTVLGIGGALTDAAAETFYKLPKEKQQELIRAYFDPVAGIAWGNVAAAVLRCVGELLCEIHRSLRKGRHSGLGLDGAERTDGQPDVGIVHLQRASGTRVYKNSRPGFAQGRTGG